MKNLLFAAWMGVLLAGCGRSNDDDKALFEAIRAQDTKRVERILAKRKIALDPPPQPNLVNKPLAYAAGYGNLEIVKLILARGADINGQVAYGDVPLIKAAEHGNKDIIVYLLEQGADVNKPNAFGISPFIGFCATGPVELVQLALEHGGKVNDSYLQQTQPNQGKKNYSALQAAVAYGKTDVVKLLLAHGGDPDLKDARGNTCLDLAREKGHQDLIAILQSRDSGTSTSKP
jgi:ankyrin repeat protein